MCKKFYFIFVLLPLISCNQYQYGSKDIKDVVALDSRINKNFFLSCDQTLLADNYIRSLFDERCDEHDEYLKDYENPFGVQYIEQSRDEINYSDIYFSLEMIDGTIKPGEKTLNKGDNSSYDEYIDFEFELNFNLKYNLGPSLSQFFTQYSFGEITLNFYLKSFDEPTNLIYSVNLTKDNCFSFIAAKSPETIVIENVNEVFSFLNYDKYKIEESISFKIDTGSWESGKPLYQGLKEFGVSYLLYSNIIYRTGIDVIQFPLCNIKCYRLFVSDDKPILLQTSPCGFIIHKDWLKRDDIFGCTILNNHRIHGMDCL